MAGKLNFLNDHVSLASSKLMKSDREDHMWSKFSYDHFFRELSFGNKDQQQQILERFSDNPDQTNFDMVKAEADKNWMNYSFDP